MKTGETKKFGRKLLAGAALAGFLVGNAQAGNIYLTGHDVLFHTGQNTYDDVILTYLADGIAPTNYDLGVLRGVGGSLTAPTDSVWGTVDVRNPSSFTDLADFTSWLGGFDALVIGSHINCGGCTITDADVGIINGFASAIHDFFNAGGDIYANSGANNPNYYNFLPPGAVATGASISGSFGFVATADGIGIGILNNMINGFPTHNRFTSFSPGFTVFETRPVTGAPDEIISIGLRGGTIIDDIIVVPSVPEPATLALVAVALIGFGFAGRRRS